ncbi:MAG: ABC transporter permease [Lachnospiraceae bacterium]|nr:ABC transporter permease [Lachnospiraceae bacterium]
MKEKKTGGSRLKISNEKLKFIAIPLTLFIIILVLDPADFLTVGNFRSMSFQMVELGLISLAMMFAFISGSIDLSLASTANIAAMVVAFILKSFDGHELTDQQWGWVLVLCIFAAAAAGVLCGLFNGFLVAKCKLQPMLATLGSMYLFSGIVFMFTQGKSIAGFPELISDFGNGTTFGIANTLFILIFVIVLSAVLLNKMRFGKELKYFGTNKKASLFSGINNSKIMMKVFVLCGLIAGITGFEYVIKINTAKADYGASYVFTSVLCISLGGVSPSGGKGGVFGVVCGLIAMQLLSSGFSILGLGTSMKNFLWGVLLLGVMVFNYYLECREMKKKYAGK